MVSCTVGEWEFYVCIVFISCTLGTLNGCPFNSLNVTNFNGKMCWHVLVCYCECTRMQPCLQEPPCSLTVLHQGSGDSGRIHARSVLELAFKELRFLLQSFLFNFVLVLYFTTDSTNVDTSTHTKSHFCCIFRTLLTQLLPVLYFLMHFWPMCLMFNSPVAGFLPAWIFLFYVYDVPRWKGSGQINLTSNLHDWWSWPLFQYNILCVLNVSSFPCPIVFFLLTQSLVLQAMLLQPLKLKRSKYISEAIGCAFSELLASGRESSCFMPSETTLRLLITRWPLPKGVQNRKSSLVPICTLLNIISSFLFFFFFLCAD